MAKDSKRFTHSKTRQNIALGLLVLIVALLGVAAFRPGAPTVTPEMVAEGNADAAERRSKAADTPSKNKSVFADWGKAIALLSDADRPWTMLVLGDSTGNDADEWVHLVAKDLAAEHDRTVTVHNWSNDTNGYVSASTYGHGSNAPITIWNSSASTKPAEYSLEHFKVAAPEQPDLAIINHGHNGTSSALSTITDLSDQVASSWKKVPALAVTLQNPQNGTAAAAEQEQLLGSLERRWAARSDVELIDVRTAFKGSTNLSALLMPDGLHPSPLGSEVWGAEALSHLR